MWVVIWSRELADVVEDNVWQGEARGLILEVTNKEAVKNKNFSGSSVG